MGGLALACILNRNNVDLDINFENQTYVGHNLINGGDKTGISDIFDKNQLRLIELAFENGDGFFGDYYDNYRNKIEEEEKAIDFGKKYKTSKNRLIAIMENIIENKGVFKPWINK